MSKRIIMFCAAVVALALAIPAYAAVQNVKVSGDLTVKALDRYNFALGRTDVNSGGHQSVIFSIARLRIDAELTDNVSVVLRLLNERVWDEEDNATTDVDIDLAYAVLKEMLYSPLTMTIGRQELHFGNDLIIGDPDTNGLANAASALVTAAGTLTDLGDLSARKAFDAFRGTLNYIFADQPLTIDLVYAKIDENTTNRDDDVNLYGANVNYPVNDDILTEVYVWTRDRDPNSIATINGRSLAWGPTPSELESERLVTIGSRGVYTGIDNLTLQGEFAVQVGEKYMDSGTLLPNLETAGNMNNNPNGLRIEDELVRQEAWALQLIADYVFEGVRHEPTLGVSYTHLSGENPSDCSGSGGYDTNDWNAWDGMYENQAGGTIWNKLIGFSNCDLINVNASVKPDFIDDLTILANWYHIRLDESLVTDTTAGVILTGVTGGQTYTVGSDKHLGDEIDIDLIYDYTEDVQLGLSLGWFIPGDTLKPATNSSIINKDSATQAIASMKVTF